MHICAHLFSGACYVGNFDSLAENEYWLSSFSIFLRHSKKVVQLRPPQAQTNRMHACLPMSHFCGSALLSLEHISSSTVFIGADRLRRSAPSKKPILVGLLQAGQIRQNVIASCYAVSFATGTCENIQFS